MGTGASLEEHHLVPIGVHRTVGLRGGPLPVPPPDAENLTSGGVEGTRGAIHASPSDPWPAIKLEERLPRHPRIAHTRVNPRRADLYFFRNGEKSRRMARGRWGTRCSHLFFCAFIGRSFRVAQSAGKNSLRDTHLCKYDSAENPFAMRSAMIFRGSKHKDRLGIGPHRAFWRTLRIWSYATLGFFSGIESGDLTPQARLDAPTALPAARASA